ncbi:nucleotide pyrophosphohydrolase [Yinghuangia soli]|uniref:Nucleotide pyrophosphohydrolase n=1 Tax=Yinghuangia soli TaxID=2908204 RepID=A0AA41Q6V1_9ACTN|nr:nucleotide pyrophosphohydrolase [Yinghuangia soli]MCF2531786.1 nucleotide pyrophosphohydrolase [Yinghuangia soli]
MTSPEQDSLDELSAAIRTFAAERNWEPFHTPKNLVMALSVEASELVEIFQWLTPEQAANVMDNPEVGEHVREEVADVFAYLLGVCGVLGIDLAQALRDKLVKNALKYPTPKPLA